MESVVGLVSFFGHKTTYALSSFLFFLSYVPIFTALSYSHRQNQKKCEFRIKKYRILNRQVFGGHVTFFWERIQFFMTLGPIETSKKAFK